MANKNTTVTTDITASKNLTSDLRAYRELPLKEQLYQIQHAHGQIKCNLIFNSKKPEIVVPRLHPQELYLTINELGAEDSLDLIALASPQQITLILDLDCWDGDTLNPDTSLNWLEFLLHCGEEKICQIVREIEPQLLALILKKHLTIIRGIEAYDDDDAENAKRLESLYDIDYRSEDAAKIIGALIKVWQELEQNHFLQMMEILRSEQLTVLEEEVLQQRNMRLLDFGILPEHEAKAIYAYIDPQTFTTGGKSDFLLEAGTLHNPMALLNTATPPDLLAAVLEGGISHETACEMLHLANRKFRADGIDLSSGQDVKESLQSIYNVLNLALEFLTNRDNEAAARVIDTTYIQRLFQLGHSLIMSSQGRIKKLKTSPFFHYFDEPENTFLDALQQQPPHCYQQGDDQNPPTFKPIATMQQLKHIEQRLTEIEALTELFSELFTTTFADETVDNPASYGLSGIMMTAVANQLLKDQLIPDMIDRDQLCLLREKTIKNGQLDAGFSDQVEQFITRHNPNCTFFAAYCLNRWFDFFSTFAQHSEFTVEPFLLLKN